MNEVKKTKRYDIFIMHENNRPIDLNNLKKIKNSIKLNNMLEFRPIMCNSKMQILDGQHRFIAARELDLEVYYQIKEDAVDEDMILLNDCQKRWLISDYINYHASKGSLAHAKLKKFCEENNLKYSQGAELLAGSRHSARIYEIKKGIMQCPSDEEIKTAEKLLNDVRDVVSTIEKYLPQKRNFLKSDRVTDALMSLSMIEGYDKEEMKGACLKRIDIICQKSTKEGYFLMFKEIYNYGKRNKRLD